MIKIENVVTPSDEMWKLVVNGMRNPLASWDKSDSGISCDDIHDLYYEIGKNDIGLMNRLFKAGTEHRKFMRQLQIGMEITSNQVFWLEFDTYKVGTTKNSCSKMHKIHVKSFEYDDFSHEGIDEIGKDLKERFCDYLKLLEQLRLKFNETHEKKYWRAMIEMLPSGFNLKATVTMNYENACNIIKQRNNHKMFEWQVLVDKLKELPYITQIMCAEGNTDNVLG